MNKRRRGTAVLHPGGFASEEAAARAVNAEVWEPMAGMVKKRCARCRYWFAVPVAEAEATARCPDCSAEGTKTAAGPT